MLVTANEKLIGQIDYLVKNRKLCFEPGLLDMCCQCGISILGRPN
jgi:hypothetical protein